MMLSVLRILFVFLVLITETSCMVVPQGLYFKPSCPDPSAELERSMCYGSAGPPTVLKLPAGEGIIIRARLDTQEDDTNRLRLVLDIPRGSSVQFASGTIRFTDPDSGHSWTVDPAVIEVQQGPSAPIPACGIVNFDQIGPTAPSDVPEDVSWKDFHVRIPFSISNYYPRRIKMILPPFMADDKKIEIPSMQFDKGRQVDRWWPYETTQQEDGSWIRFDGFTIGGGLTGGYIDNKFGGNIMLSFPPSVKWRFSTNMIRIADLDTGREYQAGFDAMYPHFSMTTEFTTPVFNKTCNMAVTASTTITLTENPQKALVVQLPDLIVNGKIIHFKPITFKKVSVSLSLLPFNC